MTAPDEFTVFADELLSGTPFETTAHRDRLALTLREQAAQQFEDFADEARAREQAAYDAHIDRQIDRLRDGDL